MIRLAIIIGSTRPGRKAEAVGRWVHEIATRRSDAEFEIVDIEDFDLPLLDEPVPPSLGLVMVVSLIESTGGFLAVGEMTGRAVSRDALARGLRADGLGTIIGGLFNTFP